MKRVYFLLIATTVFYAKAQTQVDFEPFGLGDNKESYLTKSVKFKLSEVPTFLVIECDTPSINIFNEYQSLINKTLENILLYNKLRMQYPFWGGYDPGLGRHRQLQDLQSEPCPQAGRHQPHRQSRERP